MSRRQPPEASFSAPLVPTEQAPERPLRPRPERFRPTITDVAERAGVSRATVSLVLNDVPGARISEATRERVRSAAKALDFQPDAVAKALSAFKRGPVGKVGAIALLFTDAATAWWGHEFLAATREYCGETLVAALDCGGDAIVLADYARRLRGRVDGMILVRSGPDDTPPAPALLKERIVLIGLAVEDDPVPTVVFDDYPGGLVATRHLLAAGHRRIAVLDDGSYIGQKRVAGYGAAMAEAGLDLDPALTVVLPSMGAAIDTVLDRLLALDQPPTAMLCPSNGMAVNVLLHLTRRGVQVPRDMALIGHGDDALARTLNPALSVTAPPIVEMAQWGVRMLQQTTPQPGRVTLACTVLSRQTG